jgi:hypothetical protein
VVQSPYYVVTLEIIERGHNYIYVTSDDVPELNLWGPPSVVLSQLEPALKSLFKHNKGMDVEVFVGHSPKAPTTRSDSKSESKSIRENDFPTRYVVAMAA